MRSKKKRLLLLVGLIAQLAITSVKSEEIVGRRQTIGEYTCEMVSISGERPFQRCFKDGRLLPPGTIISRNGSYVYEEHQTVEPREPSAIQLEADTCMKPDIYERLSQPYKFYPIVVRASFGDQKKCSVRGQFNTCIKSFASYLSRYLAFQANSDGAQIQLDTLLDITSSIELQYEQHGATIKNIELFILGNTNSLAQAQVVISKIRGENKLTGQRIEKFADDYNELCDAGNSRSGKDFIDAFRTIIEKRKNSN